jgi:hypothetical protein
MVQNKISTKEMLRFSGKVRKKYFMSHNKYVVDPEGNMGSWNKEGFTCKHPATVHI